MICYRIGRLWLLSRFERLAPRIETWNGSKLLLFYFFLFYIQYSGRFFCIFQMNEKLCKKKKTSFISRIKLKFLIFQYISLVSLLSSLVKRIFSCKFLMCNVDGISHELCHICACEYIFILTGDYLFIRYVVVKRNRNVIKYIYIY